MVVLRSHHPQSQSSLRRELDKRAKNRTTQQHQHARFTTVFIPLLCRLCSISTVTNVNHLNEKNVFEVSISRNEWIKSWIETHFKPRSVSVVLVRSAQMNAHSPSHPIRLSDKKTRARNEACLCHLRHGFIQTKKVNCGECCVCLHCLTQEDSLFSSDMIICWLSRSQNDLFQCERENVKSTWKIKSNKSCVHFQCFAQLFCSVGTN